MKGNVRIFAYDVNSKIQNSPKVSLEHGFCASGADGSTISSLANPCFSSGLTSIAGLLFLSSTKYFQSAASPGRGNFNIPPAQSPVRWRKWQSDSASIERQVKT
ncbi:MAG: hypothetical protein V9G42_02695 [Bacteroidia bacterium]|jgi:hypothetical protein